MTEQPPKDEENLGSFYMGRMRNPPEPRRILPKGMLTVLTVLAFAGFLWAAYPQGQEKYSALNVPTITADKSAYKFKPEDPGGMEVPHQDSTVFDPMDNKSADNNSIEKLGATPEEPVDRDAILADAPIDKQMERMNLDVQIKELPGGTEKVIIKPETETALTAEPAAGEDDEDVKAAAAPEKPAAVKTETAKIAVKTETAKPAPVKTAEKPAAAPAPAKKGGIYIQLGAYRDLKAAKADWAMLQKKYPQSLGKLSMHLETADLGAKGVYHRLQSQVASEDKARQICTVMKQSGNPDCMVVH